MFKSGPFQRVVWQCLAALITTWWPFLSQIPKVFKWEVHHMVLGLIRWLSRIAPGFIQNHLFCLCCTDSVFETTDHILWLCSCFFDKLAFSLVQLLKFVKYLSVCEEIFKWHSDYVLWDFLKYRMLIQLLSWFITGETYLFLFCCVPVPWTQPYCYAPWKLWIFFWHIKIDWLLPSFFWYSASPFESVMGIFVLFCWLVFCIGSNYAV